jgi:hypothetical protein
MKYFHQHDQKGNHRLGRGVEEGTIVWGIWASYTTPARLGNCVAVTEFCQSTEFPDSRYLYRVTVEGTVTDMQA